MWKCADKRVERVKKLAKFVRTTFMDNPFSYDYFFINTFCFQAAEKALKAACFMTDYMQIMTHYLPSITLSLNDQLSELARDLQNTVVRDTDMRYPTVDNIPHAMYDVEKAEKTKELATKIIECVDRIVSG